ncbi:hypothetical protein [Bogoriella caseilytica]|uniref:Uncharacterized protein n=1 Tax=Bogoriella caseilytica TaxID=56055 RepID=A0A3N2BD68_9MICO|nr:hypothetical protein [Bogoriella caseilytica]ROR73200.1 hypothetical protein EDD31_1572 [Bogoriella caseilytica]
MTTSDSDRAPEATSAGASGTDVPGSPTPEAAEHAPPEHAPPEHAPPGTASPESPATAAPAPPASEAPAPPSASSPAAGPTRRTRPTWLATTSSPPASPDREEDLESTAVRRQGLLAPTATPARGGSAASPVATEPTVALPAGRTPPEQEPEAAEDAALLDGATQVRPPSRAWAHVLTPFLTLLLVPIAWYLIADGGARLAIAQTASPGQLAVWPMLEVLAGLALAAGILALARWSALGAIIIGALVTLISLPFLLAPGWATDLVAPAMTRLENLGLFDALGPNIAYHLQADALVGRLTLYALGLLLLGILVTAARRAGRDDQRAEDAYARSTHRPAA